MAVRLRLMRMGKKKQPTYRVVAADARSPRNGRFIEIVGTYDPRSEPSTIKIDNERAVHWLRHGAKPSERVEKLLKVSGAWSDFTGEAPPPQVTVAASAAESAQITVAESAQDDSSDAAVAAAEAPAADDSSDAAVAAAEASAADEAPDAAVAAAEAPAADEAPDAAVAAAEAPAEDGAASEAGPHGEGSAAPLPDNSMPEGFPIKGNVDSMKFHEPGSRYYDATIAEVWFATTEAAEAAGFAAPGSAAGSESDES